MKYDNILKNVEFENFRAKVKVVTVTIFRKKNVNALAPSFIDRFCYNFTQMFSMKIS